MLQLGGADGQINVWKANFSSCDAAAKKTATRPRIRPSIAGDMRGVDVQRVVATDVMEDNQDIEDANTSACMEPAEVDATLKKITDLLVADGKAASRGPHDAETDENGTGNDKKSVPIPWPIFR